ncbi:MAG: hypothetical protein QN140_04175 [Armatimonadota bacterium]|nr:hypothetical protein [Armatimonadota bacterium]MDR7438361.1 hypothetical protein [Armatimonadota bacterium]MDR7563373.1 hypothetical protein [Armatimonadota bacterium]MDR7567439.1 hypothetical protein [Armatimonadota bacterium]
MRTPRADHSLPDSVSFLATLLARFGEFSSAALLPAQGTLRLVLFLPQALPPAIYRTFRRRVLDALAVLHELERRAAPRVWIRQTRTRHFTRIEVVRELTDLMCEELGVLAHLAREMLPLGSPRETWPEEERVRQEERLREELEHLRERENLRPLVGLREEDRVFIYAVEAGRQSTLD